STVSTPFFTAPNIDNEESIVLSFVLTGYVPGSGYAQDTAIVKVLPVNHPPLADAGPDQTVRELSRVKLVGTGSDPDGDRITTSWSQVSGPDVIYNQFATELSFVAPDAATDETISFEFELRVRDSHGAVTTDTAIVDVNAINHPPVANAGPDQTVREGTSVQLSGFGFDSDNDPLTYTWNQKSGPQIEITQSESSLSFVAPSGIPNKLSVMVFEFGVSDSFGGSDSDTVNVTVVAANNGPSANAGPDTDIDENTPLTLSCTGSDPDGDRLFYSWKQLSGLSVELTNPNSSTLSFVAPSVVKTSVLEFECTVTDGTLSSSDTVNVTVHNTLTLDIVADAGDDRIVDENQTLSLDGSGSHDPENQPLNYSWVQLSGESVSLSNTSSITPSFTSPSVANGEIKVLTFELTVSDDNNRSDSDTVTITVDPINAPPQATATAKQIS
ncbi:MAG: Ig-like domain-containing protein, partial [Nitrosopumilus sp.]|nr:Ig-like domain-containing protein [Nitrosopumilus sp.]